MVFARSSKVRRTKNKRDLKWKDKRNTEFWIHEAEEELWEND